VNGYTTGYSGEYKNDSGFVRPQIWADVGFDINPNLGVGLAYGIDFNVYNEGAKTEWSNETNVTANSATAYTASVTETTTTYENTDITNKITPSVWWNTNIGERLKLGVSGKVAVNIRTASETPKYESTVTSVSQGKSGGVVTSSTSYVSDRYSGNSSNDPTETTDWSLTPTATVGLQWQIIPNRLALNAGLSLDVFKFVGEKTITKPKDITTHTEYDPAGNITNVSSSGTASYTDREVVKNTFNFFGNATIPLGLTVNVTDKFTLDALTAFNVSTGGNLTNITSLLFTVKF
jgi:hypothetical protein